MPFAAYIWLALLIVFGIVEAATAALTSIWFAAGALAATAAALLGGPLWLQILLFLVVSAAALAVTRPLVRRYVDSRKVPTNVGRLMGQTARVTEDIDNIAGTGAVYIDGKEWNDYVVSGSNVISGTLYAYGAHTITVYVAPGYEGIANITVNGQAVTSGTFELTGDTEIVVTGITAIDYSQIGSGSSGSDDGLGLTDILLIILVVLIVIMAIMVAMRLMRS